MEMHLGLSMETSKKSSKAELNEIKTADTYAIFQTGGKQYQAIEGKTVAIEKIEGEPGAKVEFKDVLLRKLGDNKIEIGHPYLNDAVKASIVKQMRGPKVTAFRFKRRKKVQVKTGHRQEITIIRIEAI